MCKVIEDMLQENRRETMAKVAHRMLAAGKYSLEEIADLTELSVDEIKKLKAGQSA